MCGRFCLTTNSVVLGKEFGIDPAQAARLVARFNIAPSQPVALILGDTGRNSGSNPGSNSSSNLGLGSKKLDYAIWGLIPTWSKDPTVGARLINARSETVLEKPSFKTSFLHRRCLIPADGYYEWKREGPQKRPYFFREKSGRPFAMAGIWSDWEDGDGGQIRTCAILTRAAEGRVREVHDRMPVTVPADAQGRWLDFRLSAPTESAALLGSLVPVDLEIYPVSTRVNDPRHDDLECITRNDSCFRDKSGG